MLCDTQVTTSATQCNVIEVATVGPQGPPGNNLTAPTTVALLGAPTAGLRSMVIDATSNAFATQAIGGGSFTVPVFGDGVVWWIG